jgi:cytochrome b
MNKTNVYDLPTRLFHWVFAVLFLSAFVIGKFVADDSSAYAYHMLIGLVLALTVVLRLIWIVIGSRYAKFSSFLLRPNDLFRYFKELLTGKIGQVLGHNPASSWAAVVMMGLALGLAITGYLMTTGGNKEVLEGVHELFSTMFIVVVIGHIAGLVLHTWRYQDGIVLSMVNGKKESIAGQVGIRRNYLSVAALFLLIIGAFVFQLGKIFDREKQSLRLFGQTLQLGESVEQSSNDE